MKQPAYCAWEHSKDHRPDLRQDRQLLGTLDPAGVPLVSETLAGNGADDPEYVPTWHRKRNSYWAQKLPLYCRLQSSSSSNPCPTGSSRRLLLFPLTQHGSYTQLVEKLGA